MTDLWGRRWSLSVGNLDLSECDLKFKVIRHIHRNPNTAEIGIFNLSPETRAAVEGSARPFTRPGRTREEIPEGIVRLALGYGEDEPGQVFRGDNRVAWTEWPTDVDSITTIQARDGGHAYSEGRISRAYPAGTSIATVAGDLIEALAVGEGNLSEFRAEFRMRTGASTFPDGFVAHGRAHVILSSLARAAGLRWSIQSGAVQFQRQGEALASRSVYLSADSGLVGTPTWDERGKRTANRTGGRRGVATVQCLIMPGLDPGRKVVVESDTVEGNFEIRQVTLTGDTRGNDWFAELLLRPY